MLSLLSLPPTPPPEVRDAEDAAASAAEAAAAAAAVVLPCFLAEAEEAPAPLAAAADALLVPFNDGFFGILSLSLFLNLPVDCWVSFLRPMVYIL